MSFPYGHELMRRMMQYDPDALEAVEKPLRRALHSAQKEAGYVYKSPESGQQSALDSSKA